MGIKKILKKNFLVLIMLVFTSVFILIGILLVNLPPRTKQSLEYQDSFEPQQAETTVTTQAHSEPLNSDELFTVNAYSSVASAFQSFRIKFPSSYVVTSDDMIADYKSQGGMAPPRLILTKGAQPLKPSGPNGYDYASLFTDNKDCIMIHSTQGFKNIDDWEYTVYPEVIPLAQGGSRLERNKVNVHSNNTIKVGDFDGIVREVSDEIYPRRIEIFVKMPDNSSSFFFHTCNMSTKEDLYKILEHFDIRGEE